jgi:molybdopterin/thiamine biosynthesis adenylyltransferase
MATANRLPRRPRLRDSVEVLDASDGDLYLLSAVGDDIALRSPGRAQRALLAALDGSRAPGEIIALVVEADPALGAEDVTAAIGELHAMRIVEDADDDEHPDLDAPDRAAFDRQLRYLADVGTGEVTCGEAQARLRRSTVAVIGLGGLGSWVALSLAMAGVGRIVGYDDDVVETSNLHRQILYRPDDLGRSKAEVAGRRLAAQAPWTEVDARAERLSDASQVALAVRGADLVVEAADWPAHLISRWVDEACRAERIAHIAASLAPPLARVGPLIVPGVTPCYRCQEAMLRARSPLYDEVVAMRSGASARAANSAPALGAVATLLATDAVHYLSGARPPATLGASMLLDLRSMLTSREALQPDPSCGCTA